MEKLWEGKFHGQLDQAADDFNSSIRVDSRMYKEDIMGSIAHVEMLAKQGIILSGDAETIGNALFGILGDIKSGYLKIDPQSEDIHSFVEKELTKRVGDAGKKLHTARSRNDQVTLDLRLSLRAEIDEIVKLLKKAAQACVGKAKLHADTVMPGYTHLQRAQPITFGHHLMAYVMMFLRDIDRFSDCRKRLNQCPLGCAALAGTTYPIDRVISSNKLGFDAPCMNSMDGVSDRDYAVELAADISIAMMHLSRMCEEILLWCSYEFKFVELADAYSTGSSIMPQKKNPDIAELIRGKTGRVYGSLMALLTMLKGLPLAYNKDMQEDKEAIFDSVDTLKQCLNMFAPMLTTMTVHTENMRQAAAKGFINATDCADYLTKAGVPFRTAYQITGDIVAYCIEKGKTLETLGLDKYKNFSPLFKKDIYDAIDLDACVKRRASLGGTAPEKVMEQIAYAMEKLQ